VHTILSLVNAKMAYQRGLETGMAGVVGIFIAIIIVFLWDFIEPVFTFLGVTGFLNWLGLIEAGGPELSFLRVFMFILVTIIAVQFLFFIIFSPIMFYFADKGERQLSNVLFTVFVVIPFLPLWVILALVYLVSVSYIRLHDWQKRKKLGKDGYEEHESARKGYINISLLDKLNVPRLTFDQARLRLNALPTHESNDYVIAVNNINEAYLVLPVSDYFDGRTFAPINKHIKIARKIKLNSVGKASAEWEFEENEKVYKMIDLESCNHFYDPVNHPLFENKLQELQHDYFYHDLIHEVIEVYNKKMNWMKEELAELNQNDQTRKDNLELNMLKGDIEKYKARNAERALTSFNNYSRPYRDVLEKAVIH